jgi:predicted dithiol-disulfide oxidoreductase (DUF899 family)
MSEHAVVSHEEWLEARLGLLQREKQLTRLRDELSRERRALPWERVERIYDFDTPEGRKSLADLFDGCSQLVIYHFMFAPDWDEGCPSCSWWAESFDRNVIHLKHRDTTLMAVSHAPLDKLQAYRKRMGWTFPWASSYGSDFNYDYQVSFSPQEIESGSVCHNYREEREELETELPGVSVFYRDPAGDIYHTYSAYRRGIDALNAGYQYLDLTPKGRDEDEFEFTMAWLRRRDQYED